jgi:hypothetical protein
LSVANNILVCGEGKAKKDLIGKSRQKRSAQAPVNNVEEDGDLK